MGRKEHIAPCRLCRREAKLCRSHIVPEWAHRPVYDERSTALFLESPGGRRRKVQVGHREYLLCVDCEERIERIETRFRLHWSEESRLPSSVEGPYLALDDTDFQTTTLFLLSILWRAHEATQRTYKSIDLCERAEAIRLVLLGESDFASLEKYPVFAFLLVDDTTNERARFLLTTPALNLDPEHPNYQIVLMGVLWVIFLGAPAPAFKPSCQLQEAGTLVMPVVDYASSPLVRHFFAGHTTDS